MMKKIYLIIVMIFCSVGVWAQVLTENFSYTAGTAITANGWTSHSAGGTNAILVTTPGLIYAGHPGSGVGNAITMATSGEDDNRVLSSAITSGTAYASFLVNISAAQATGDYFIGLYTSSSVFPIRIFARASGAGFVFGINKSGGATTYESTVRSFGTTYFIVTSYVYNTATTTDDAVNLWVDPPLGGAQPAATIANITGAPTDVSTITAFYVRQGSATAAPTPRVDAILVGTTWAHVNPPVGGATINVSPATLTGFTSLSGVPSAEQSYIVDGTGLTENIIITPPVGFEITLTSGSGYVSNPSTITLNQGGGVVLPTTIYVRMNSATLGTNSGSITHTSAGANNPSVSLTGHVITTAPSSQGAISFGAITTNSIVVNFTSGDGAKRILVARAGSAVNSDPVDGTTYTANANFASGTQIGTGNYVVYAGTGNSVTVTGLSPTTTYHFAVYEYNDAGIAGAENYLTATPGTGNATTLSTDGDFRSVATGAWSDVAIWQERVANNWVAAATIPSSLSNVYIQAGHTVTVDIVTALSNDLHISTTGVLAIGVNTIEVNGKLRAYTGAAVTTLGPDATFYSGQASTSSVGGSSITSTVGSGEMKVVGNTRNFTNTGEWGNNPPGWDIEFAPTAGQILTIQTGFKAANITVSSGTVLSTSTDFRPDGGGAGLGSITVKSGATLQFSNIAIALQRTATANATSHFGALTVEAGGTLEFSGTSSPVIGAGTVTFTGNVIYSGAGNQTFAVKGSNSAAADPNTYTNITIAGGGNKTLPMAVTVNGILTLTSGNVVSTATNLLIMSASSSVSGASNASFVFGPVKKIGNTNFTFPVGKANGLVPLRVSNFAGASTPTDEFTAEYIRASGAALGPVTAPLINRVSGCEYWTLNVNNGTPTVDLTLYWNANNPCNGTYITNINDIEVVHFDGVNWDNSSVGFSSKSGTAAAGDVTWPAVSTFSPFTLGSTSAANPLPITINYFNGTKQNGNHLLNWKVTCISTPSATLEMQRSTDGRNYNTIYSIFATAVRCEQPFDYTDNQPAKGTNYYRLKMTDVDGKVTYSSIVHLINAVKGMELMNISPNPIENGRFNLKVSAAEKTQMELLITDMQGRILQKQSVSMTAGFNSIPVSVQQLSAGTYQLFGNTTDGRTRVLRFVIQ